MESHLLLWQMSLCITTEINYNVKGNQNVTEDVIFCILF
jgi:hypothetical protein